MLKLPKGYLSWSQVQLWNKSKKQYRDRYFEGKPMYVTEYMRYGSHIGGVLEHRNPTTEIEQSICDAIPDELLKESRYEFEIEGVPVLGFLDAEKANGFDEYKTSVNPWDQKKVDNHGQLHLYSLGYMIKHGELPQDVKLFWIETFKYDTGVSATGRVEVFSYVPTVSDIKAIEELFIRTAKEISADYIKWLQGAPKCLVPIQEFVNIQRQLSIIESQVEEKKESLKQWLIENEYTDFSNEDVTIYYQTRKKYSYSDSVKDLEAKLKALKKEEEEDADCVESKTLVVKVK